MRVDEIEIVRQAQSGDREAFDHLMKLHAGSIYNFTHRFMHEEDDVDDVIQEVFLKALQNLHRYDPTRGMFKSWLFRIAANTSMDIQKKRRSAHKYKIQHNTEEDLRTDNPGHSDRSRQDKRELQAALQSLPGRERQVVLLFFYHDLSNREISEILGLPLGTVKSRMRSAVIRLRKQIL
jgi:RNA polymerase sigma-70 factor (ECF subfamily)